MLFQYNLKLKLIFFEEWILFFFWNKNKKLIQSNSVITNSSGPAIFVRYNRVYLCTGGPRYPRSFYPQIRFFTFETLVKKAKFLVKMCLFICEFSVLGPNKREVSTWGPPVLQWPIWLQKLFVITEWSLTTEFVLTEFYCIYLCTFQLRWFGTHLYVLAFLLLFGV